MKVLCATLLFLQIVFVFFWRKEKLVVVAEIDIKTNSNCAENHKKIKHS